MAFNALGWANLGVSALSGIANFLGGNKNIDKQIKAQQEENRKNREYNLMLAQQQNQWNQEQWERENEFNTPANQIKRMKEAQLSPDMVYGNGAAQSIAASSPQMTSGASSNPVDMSALGQKMTLGQAIQQTLSNEMMQAQIDNIKQKTKSEQQNTSILESDARFRDAINQGTINLNNLEIDLGNSKISLNSEQANVFRKQCAKLEQETKNLDAEYDKIRASIANIDSDTASRMLHDALDSAKVEAEIKKLASSIDVDLATAKRITTLLTYEKLGLQAQTAESWANVSIKGAEQVQIEATTESIRYDLSSAKKWIDIERGTGVYGKIMQGLTPIANLIGIAIGSGALRSRPNKIGFR